MGSWLQLVPPFHRSANSELPSKPPPTTMQLAADVQETPPSTGSVAAGVGKASTDHVLPSQTSTAGLAAKTPAAMHAVALVQDTAPNACGPSGGSVVASRVHALPFHDSASACTPLLVSNRPVAMHTPAAGQEMPAKLLLTAPGGTGVGSWVQAEPFQRSARAPSASDPVLPCPTAMHRDGLVQARPVKISRAGAVGGGSVRHFVPFHASKIGAPAWSSPTARQLVGLGHETAVSDARPSRDGVANTRHAVPFQISLSGLGCEGRTSELPTAMQNLPVGQDTAANERVAGGGADTAAARVALALDPGAAARAELARKAKAAVPAAATTAARRQADGDVASLKPVRIRTTSLHLSDPWQLPSELPDAP
jgi:hypothetical protein